jgi:hypothetical protein
MRSIVHHPPGGSIRHDRRQGEGRVKEIERERERELGIVQQNNDRGGEGRRESLPKTVG